jgi:platelet-activating factor acetylhydrolase isoform II
MTTQELSRRRAVIGALAAGLALALPGGAALADTTAPATYRVDLPEPTGRYPIGTTELHLVDEGRADPWVPGRTRELMVGVWYPAYPSQSGERAPYMRPGVAKAQAELVAGSIGVDPSRLDLGGSPTHARAGAPALGRHPVVIYSPGLGTSRLYGTNHVEELASRGYVVVTIDHTGETPVEFPGGRVTGTEMPSTGGADLMRRTTAARVADTRFVLDQLAVLQRGGNPDAERRALPHGLGRALDLRRTGMFGYSLGGFTAGETMLVDRRIDAGMNLDGTMMYDFAGQTGYSDVVRRGLDRPFLLMGAMGHHHRSRPGDPMHDTSWAVFWRNQRGWKLDLQIADGTHGAFADYQFILPQLVERLGLEIDLDGLLGTVDPDASVRAQRAYLGAFFERFLRHRPQPLLSRESPRYPEVTFIR